VFTTLERFIALIVGISTIAGIALRISFQVGKLVSRVDAHLEDAIRYWKKTDDDIRELRGKRR